LGKSLESLQKKQDAAAGEKEAAAQAEQDRWATLLAELGNY
jgi:hypothetical protein